MKIEEFVKIKGMKDMIDKRGGGYNSNYIQNKIYDIVIEGLADNDTEKSIKFQVRRFLKNYEIQTKKLEKQTVKLMEKWGFHFD